MIHSGDEPHNLVLINSVVNDGDLDVKNNYVNVHQGGNDAGTLSQSLSELEKQEVES